jgi:putative inorganic carbon (HCO3(-)) transporter
MIYYGLLLFFIFEYIRPGNFIPGLDLLRLNSMIPLMTVAGVMLTKGRASHEDVFNDFMTRVMIGFVAMITLSVLFAEVTWYAFNVFTMVFGYILMFWVIAKETTDLSRIKGVFTVLIGVHVTLALMTPQMFTSGGRTYLASGTFLGDGNDFALSVNLVIPFCLFLLFEAKKFLMKLFYAATLLFLVLCVVLTQSRGGTIALAVVGLYYWLKSDRKVLTALCATAACVLVFAVAPPSYFERMNSISNYEEDNSAQGRLTAWGAGFRMALSNPLLGVGVGNFPPSFNRYAGKAGGRWMTAHSIYFLIMGELGFVGLLILLWFLIGNIYANRRLASELRARAPDQPTMPRLLASLSAAMLAYAVAGAFLSAAYYPHMFVLGGLLVAGRRIARLETAAAGGSSAGAPAAPQGITYHWALRAVYGQRAS